MLKKVYGDGVKAGIDKEANTALRDQFAGLAMQGLITNGWNPEGATLYAYEHADAMLKAREVKI